MMMKILNFKFEEDRNIVPVVAGTISDIKIITHHNFSKKESVCKGFSYSFATYSMLTSILIVSIVSMLALPYIVGGVA